MRASKVWSGFSSRSSDDIPRPKHLKIAAEAAFLRYLELSLGGGATLGFLCIYAYIISS